MTQELRMDEFSGEIQDTSEAAKSHSVPVLTGRRQLARGNTYQFGPPANPISGESRTSQEAQLPTDATEIMAKDKGDSSARPERNSSTNQTTITNFTNYRIFLHLPREIAAATIFRNIQFSANSFNVSLTYSRGISNSTHYLKKNATKSRPQRSLAHYYLALLVGLSHLPDGKEIGEKSGDYIYTFLFFL